MCQFSQAAKISIFGHDEVCNKETPPALLPPVYSTLLFTALPRTLLLFAQAEFTSYESYQEAV